MKSSPTLRTDNVIGPVDFFTLTTLRRSIKDAEAQWKDDYRFQKGIEKEKDLLKYFMAQI